ncbi:MAG: peroxidase family protein, partial [Pseudomonadota bacterium]
AHDPSKKHAPMMSTADMAMKLDPAYGPISKRYHENPDELADAFNRAWFKLCHRDMGPKTRYLGADVPAEDLIWQDPVPDVDHALVEATDIADLKAKLLDCGLSVSQLVKTAWASASTFRNSDKRGGANGARVRLAPQKDWEANDPAQLAVALDKIGDVVDAFNAAQSGDKKVSLADAIVLGGVAAVEKAAKDGGHEIEVPFVPGRTDASDDQTDAESFEVLEPVTDGFRNYAKSDLGRPVEELLVDKAQLMALSAPEMTVLVAGMRVLDTNTGDTKHGVLTNRPGVLSADFFRTILDRELDWQPAADADGIFEARPRAGGDVKWTGTRVDLVIGSNSQLRAIAEVYGANDGEADFVRDFASAFGKVMHADRFDLAN